MVPIAVERPVSITAVDITGDPGRPPGSRRWEYSIRGRDFPSRHLRAAEVSQNPGVSTLW